jgi:hypothetical protein
VGREGNLGQYSVNSDLFLSSKENVTYYISYSAMIGMEPRPLHMLCKCSTTELHHLLLFRGFELQKENLQTSQEVVVLC